MVWQDGQNTSHLRKPSCEPSSDPSHHSVERWRLIAPTLQHSKRRSDVTNEPSSSSVLHLINPPNGPHNHSLIQRTPYTIMAKRRPFRCSETRMLHLDSHTVLQGCRSDEISSRKQRLHRLSHKSSLEDKPRSELNHHKHGHTPAFFSPCKETNDN